jgi:hypothetical protein
MNWTLSWNLIILISPNFEVYHFYSNFSYIFALTGSDWTELPGVRDEHDIDPGQLPPLPMLLCLQYLLLILVPVSLKVSSLGRAPTGALGSMDIITDWTGLNSIGLNWTLSGPDWTVLPGLQNERDVNPGHLPFLPLLLHL